MAGETARLCRELTEMLLSDEHLAACWCEAHDLPEWRLGDVELARADIEERIADAVASDRVSCETPLSFADGLPVCVGGSAWTPEGERVRVTSADVRGKVRVAPWKGGTWLWDSPGRLYGQQPDTWERLEADVGRLPASGCKRGAVLSYLARARKLAGRGLK